MSSGESHDGFGMEELPSEGKADQRLGFGWGVLWVVLGFLQGGAALVFGFVLGVRTEYLPNRPVSLFVGLALVGSAYGILRRRKYGLYLAEAIATLGILGGIVGILLGEAISLVGALYGSLWLAYFYRRRGWFA